MIKENEAKFKEDEPAQDEQAEPGAADSEAKAQPLPHHLQGRQNRAGMY